jgi:formate dehydrogenase subunit gamma
MSTSRITVSHGTDLRGDEIVRYTLKERICHWVNGLTYMYCLFTGMALFTPYLYWIAFVLGGGGTIRLWHPIVGILFAVAVFWMHSMWRGEMKMTADDEKWMKEVKNYATNRDENVPPAGNFNAGQKQFYWFMFYGMLGLLITGLFMWFPEIVVHKPLQMHWIMPVMIFLHVVSALVTIAAFIIHVYMGLFFVSGGLQGILWGRVPGKWAKYHHALWFQKTAGQGKGNRASKGAD